MIGEKQAMQWFGGIFDRNGPTFEQKILGVQSIATIEPANIETILSDQFSGKFISLWP